MPDKNSPLDYSARDCLLTDSPNLPDSAASQDSSANSPNSSSSRKPSQSKPKSTFLNILSIALVVGGVIVSLYPVVATLIMNQSQITAMHRVESASKDLGPEKQAKMLQEAQEYNAQLHSGPILDPFLERVAPDTKLYRDYLSYVDMGDGIMGTVKIPKIKTNLPIYHGTYDRELELGAGHLFGSSLPVGGKNTHAVITAHSGLGNATMFDDLPKLKKGDKIYISILGKTLAYQVYQKEVVEPTNTVSLHVQANQDLITLITCTPYGVNTHRLLVHAKAIPFTEADHSEAEIKPQIWRIWMLIPIFLSLGAIFALFWFLKRRQKRTRKLPK